MARINLWAFTALAVSLHCTLSKADLLDCRSVEHVHAERSCLLPHDDPKGHELHARAAIPGNEKSKTKENGKGKSGGEEKPNGKGKKGRRQISLGIEPSKETMDIFRKSCSTPVKRRKTSQAKRVVDKKAPKAKSKGKVDKKSKKAKQHKHEAKSKSKSKPKSKSKKKDKRTSSEKTLVKRAPNGFTDVAMGQARARRPGENGLWSGAFGTCVGIAIVGQNIKRNGWRAYLYHVSLGTSWTDISREWDNFIEAVENSGLRDMTAYIYTPDTRWNAADVLGDSYMENEARLLEQTYEHMQNLLGQITDMNHVHRLYHAFSRAGHMAIDIFNQVTYAP